MLSRSCEGLLAIPSLLEPWPRQWSEHPQAYRPSLWSAVMKSIGETKYRSYRKHVTCCLLCTQVFRHTGKANQWTLQTKIMSSWVRERDHPPNQPVSLLVTSKQEPVCWSLDNTSHIRTGDTGGRAGDIREWRNIKLTVLQIFCTSVGKTYVMLMTQINCTAVEENFWVNHLVRYLFAQIQKT